MAEDKISENIEEYLEVLYRNGSNGEQVSTSKISDELEIAPGSVTQMLKKLEKLGYIVYTPYRGAELTDDGMKIAQKITRKHRILEKFLRDVLKVKEDNVHNQACEMEHTLSDEAERALCHMLFQPDTCPSGSIVPACDFKFNSCEECMHSNFDIDSVERREYPLLSVTQLKDGKHGKIAFIRGDESHRKIVEDQGLKIGDEVNIIEKDLSHENFTIRVNGKESSIKRSILNKVFLDTH